MPIIAPAWYRPYPEGHLAVVRDATHFKYAQDILSGHKTILDVGCFDGWLDFLLIQAGFDVAGIEKNPSLVDAARRYAKIHKIDYTIYDMPFEHLPLTKTYDAVICFQVLEEIQKLQVEHFIEKLEAHAEHRVAISLSQQPLPEGNHWAANRDWIAYHFGRKPGVAIVEVDYDSDAPGNWFITYPITQL